MRSKESKIDYVKVLEDLIKIDTSVPPGNNYGEIARYLAGLFKGVGCKTEKVHIPGRNAGGRKNRVNLLAHRRNPGKPRLIFYSHVDVVPARGWPAFEPKLKKGKLYGRGAADMKGAIPALLLALEKIKNKNNREINYDLSTMITTDEEIGQASQLNYLRRFLGPLKGAYIFSLDSDVGYVSIASLGALQFKIKVMGKSVHSAMSHLGKNAIEDAGLVLNALKKLKKKVVARKSKISVNPAKGLKKMEGRLNVNVIKGGIKENVVPDECLIYVDRRLIPEENMEEAEKELVDTLKSVKGVKWELLDTMRIPPCYVEDTITDKLALAIKNVTGKTGKYGTMGSGDLCSVASEWGAKVFGLGVIRPECNIHAKNEFVYLKDIENLREIIVEFLTNRELAPLT
jgi:succinyl-diaminopimelate desuccinylase